MLAVAPDPVCALLKFPCSTYHLVIVLPYRSTSPTFSWSEALHATRCSSCPLLSCQPPHHGPALLVQLHLPPLKHVFLDASLPLKSIHHVS